MDLFSRWLRGQPASDTQPLTSRDQDPVLQLIEKARALARGGQLHEASRLYSKIPHKRATVAIWLEHADLLLDMGDRFGAAANATHVLELEPENPRALAIRRTVLVQEDVDRKR